MAQKFDSDVLMKLKRKKRRSLWKCAVRVMMCLVVFCTTYMLILPAITKETQTFCGIEEHEHSESCYEKALLCEAHVHTEACYESCRELICTEPAVDGHTHTENCAPVTERVLSCGLEEIPAHSHTESCAPVTESLLSCVLPETEGHTHTEDCRGTERVLSCQLEESAEHTHSEACYTEVLSYLCGMEETPSHVHGDACYTVTTVYGCGLEENEGHTHGDPCYTEVTTYSCGQETDPAAHVHTEACYVTTQQLLCTLEATPDHTHTDDCYEEKLICETPVHIHSLSCYADLSADLETSAQWEATLPQLTGNYVQDVLAIAKSQLGYTESTSNYIVEADTNIKGYTRYGAWYGDHYGDWCAMFVSFCLHYADVDTVPLDANCPNWKKTLQEQDLYRAPSDYIPKAGDIIFFDWEQDDSCDHVGLVENVEDTNVITVEGNSGSRVAQNKYELHDARIDGYGILSEYLTQPEESDPPTEPEDTNAWADLLPPDTPVTEAPQAEAPQAEAQSAQEAVSTYSMRNTRQAAAQTTALDLTPFINTVTMYDADEVPIPSGSVVTEGDLIEFEITYTIPGQQLGVMNGKNVTVISDTLTYSLPEIFQVIQGSEGNIMNSAGAAVGTYVIDSEAGTITLCFGENYINQNAAGMQIQGNASFFSFVNKVTDGESEIQKYKFTDEITLGVIIEEEFEAAGDLGIEKQKVSVDGNSILYEVKVTSGEGTSGPITVADRMSVGLTFQEGLGVWKGDNTPVDNVSFNTADDNSSFTLTLPELAAGESYLIRYRCAADLNLLGADMTVRNTASVRGKDSQDHELKDEVTVSYTFELLKKTGVANGDGTITWTVTVNRDKADISGWVLEDIVSTAAGRVPFTGPVTIRDSIGNILHENTVLPYTFPDGSGDTYVLTYTTTHNLADGDAVYNTAILRDENTQVTVVSGTSIGDPIQKSGTAGAFTQDESGNRLLPITWTVTVDTTLGAIPAGEQFIDKMDSSANHVYMTCEQLLAAVDEIDAALQAAGSSVGAVSASVFSPGAGQGAVYTLEDLKNNVDNCQSFLYEHFAITLAQELAKDHVLTFTYETYGSFDNNLIRNTAFKNRFNLSGYFETEGEVPFVSGKIEATKFALHPYDPNGASQGSLNWNGMEVTSKLRYRDLYDSYLAWAIQLNVPANYAGSGSTVIYEDLPEGVSVKGLSLPFTSNVPTSRLQLQDMKPGETYTWDFRVYPPDQYDIYWEADRTGGQDVSIVITVTAEGDLEITVPGIVFETMGGYAARSNSEQAQTYLYIYTQINEDFEWTPKAEGSFVYVNTFENRFTVKDEDGNVMDIGSQAQEITRDERDSIVRKKATIEENNLIRYRVVLNEKGRDLIENSATLKIHDALTYQSTDALPLRLQLVPGSVKLYEIEVQPDGSYTKLGEVVIHYTYEADSVAQYGITTWTHTIDLNVPDGKALLLEYVYRAKGDTTTSHNVFNTCSILGVGEGSLDGDHKVEIAVRDSSFQADTRGILLYKVDANSDGIFLKDTVFNIYIWNKDVWNEETNAYGDFIIVNHPNNGGTDFITDASGMLVFDGSTVDQTQFAYNTTYRIVEKTPLNGYYLDSEPYDFYIAHKDTQAYPSCFNPDYAGHALTSGDIIYRKNTSETTQICVEKYWIGYNGKPITVTGEKVSGVTFELWQVLQNDPNSAKLYNTYTITPDADGNWCLTVTGLPRATKEADGTKGTDYLYYVKEVEVPGFAQKSAENNEGIHSGTIKLVNREREGYELPKTGGTGTSMYTAVGLSLILTSAAFLMYNSKKRRRRDSNSS